MDSLPDQPTGTTLGPTASYLEAYRILSRTKNILLFLIILAILINAASFVLVLTGQIAAASPTNAAADGGHSTTQPVGTTQPAPTTGPAEGADAVQGASVEQVPPLADWKPVVSSVNAIARVVAWFAMVVLVVVCLAGMLIMAAGRLNGISSITAAFVWSIVLALFLAPWSILGAEVLIPLPDGLISVDTIVENVQRSVDGRLPSFGVVSGDVVLYVRHLMYPVAALLLSLLVAGYTWQAGSRASRT